MASSADSDAQLVALSRAGNEGALEQLLRRHVRACYLVAFAELRESAEAEDACQDAFVKCVQHLAECRDPDRFGAWLMQIVRNVARNRRDHMRVRVTEPLVESTSIPAPGGADDHASRAELRSQLTLALSKLSAVQREVVLLHDLAGLLHDEVAVRLGISVTMSRRHLSDARRILRSLLKDYHEMRP